MHGEAAGILAHQTSDGSPTNYEPTAAEFSFKLKKPAGNAGVLPLG